MSFAQTPSRTIENNYLKMLKNEVEYDQTIPMECYVSRELSNPHSSVKRRQRYFSKKEKEQELLKTMIENELADLKGRTRRVARMEAKVKWEMAMEKARKAESERRRKARGAAQRSSKPGRKRCLSLKAGKARKRTKRRRWKERTTRQWRRNASTLYNKARWGRSAFARAVPL